MNIPNPDPAAGTELPGETNPRRHQMFPQLTEAEITRIRRFGHVQRYARGACLYAAGEPSPGMFVVLKGTVVISQRDGLRPLAAARSGPFSRRDLPLSGRPVDGCALEDVETLCRRLGA
jgi:thioredoxin reductase (NADPH)